MNKKFIYLKTVDFYSHHAILTTKKDDSEIISIKKFKLKGLKSFTMIPSNLFRRLINKNYLSMGRPDLIRPIVSTTKISHQFTL